MSIKYSIGVVGQDADNPFKSGNDRENLQRLAQVLRSVASGHKYAVYEIEARASAAQASASITCAAVQNADTVTINGQALTATQHHARGTVTIVVADTDADDTVTINGVVFTAKAAEDTAAGEFDISGTDTEAATSLVACIDANIAAYGALAGVVTAASSAGVVTIRAVSAGTGGNSITLASSDADGLAVSAATLENGAAVGNNEFDFGGTNAQTATALAAAINASTTAIVGKHVEASASSGVVTITAQMPGHSGNAITIASSDGTRLAITGGAARLTGGTDTRIQMSF